MFQCLSLGRFSAKNMDRPYIFCAVKTTLRFSRYLTLESQTREIQHYCVSNEPLRHTIQS